MSDSRGRALSFPTVVAGDDVQREIDLSIHLVDLPREARGRIDGGTTMLWTIIGILVLLWLLGFIGHVGGGLIHLLLVVALVVFVANMFTGRRTV
jgi:hypothetical protein